MQRLIHIARQILGAPDYDAYLEHCRKAGHPPRFNEREYVDQFFESKGKGVRCC
ncbi:MAG TPA: CstA-like transporter-associated (seleno)protein [Gemmatimonadales bacterium]|nr:CstA-like transporter-associated (seleno)protein [Gemmatimonadales bacterium]